MDTWRALGPAFFESPAETRRGFASVAPEAPTAKVERVGRITSSLASRFAAWSQQLGQGNEDIADALEAARVLLGAAERVLAADEAGEDPREAMYWLRDAVERSDVSGLLDAAPAALEAQARAASKISATAAALVDQSSTDVAPIDLNQAVRTAVALAEPSFEGVAVLDLDLGDLPNLLCSGGDLVHAILELLLDAARAVESTGSMGETSGRVSVRTRAHGGAVELSISENPLAGTPAGVPVPLRRGLGLARSLVADAQGGQLGISSAPSGGARVVLRIPTAGSQAA